MSTYTTVVPVAWPRLQQILPVWAEIFAGRSSPAAFRRRFCPSAWLPFATEPAGADQGWGSPGYLGSIGWDAARPWLPADALRRSPEHARLTAAGAADTATYLFLTAVRHIAAVELDRDGGRGRDVVGAHGRLPLIVEIKNRIRFLEAVFEPTYHQPDDGWIHIAYARRPGCDQLLAGLLERLFLATRSFPGLRVLPRRNTWLAVNAHLLQGCLLPGEVRALAGRLDALGAHEAAAQDGHFEPFVRHLGVVARAGYGLVAVQDFS